MSKKALCILSFIAIVFMGCHQPVNQTKLASSSSETTHSNTQDTIVLKVKGAITVSVKTLDGSKITVDGAEQKIFDSSTYTLLTPKNGSDTIKLTTTREQMVSIDIKNQSNVVTITSFNVPRLRAFNNAVGSGSVVGGGAGSATGGTGSAGGVATGGTGSGASSGAVGTGGTGSAGSSGTVGTGNVSSTGDSIVLTVTGDIRIKVTTSDNSPITVTGAEQDHVDSATYTRLSPVAGSDSITLTASRGVMTDVYLSNSKNLIGIPTANASQLRALHCYDTYIGSIDLSQVPELRTLYCSISNISSLDLSNVPQLEDLYCGYSNISHLDLSHVPQLKNLVCTNTAITGLDARSCPMARIEADPLVTILRFDPDVMAIKVTGDIVIRVTTSDGSKVMVTGAEQDSLESHAFTTLTPTSGSDIITLTAPYGLITEVILSKNDALVAIPTLSVGQLKELQVSNTGLTSLDLSHVPGLELLKCDHTQIASLDLSNTPHLNTLVCTNTAITELNLRSCPGVVVDAASSVKIARFRPDVMEIKVSGPVQVFLHTEDETPVKIIGADIDTLPYSNGLITVTPKSGTDTILFKSTYGLFVHLSIFSDDLIEVSSLKAERLHTIQMNHTPNCVSIDLSNVPQLKSLNCSMSKVSSLDLSNVPKLEQLSCVDTKVSNLNLSNVPKLSMLSCKRTAIKRLDLGRCPVLKPSSLDIDSSVVVIR